MPLELNIKNLFQDFNPSKFVVYACLLVFCLLFALRLDNIVTWSYWIIFFPLWIWKTLVVTGAAIGTWIWWRNPHYRGEIDSVTQYKAMIIATCMQLLLLMFEIMACERLNTDKPELLWTLIFVPVFLISILSIGLSIWALKHGRTLELELFFAVNILQFVFLALRLDEFVTWRWVIIFIPLWIVMCVALVGVIYAILLAIILLGSSDIDPEQRRNNVFSAVGYTFMVIPLLIFEILLVNKKDNVNDIGYLAVVLPLLISLFTLMMMAFGSRGGNHWWFGIKKDFCPWLLGACPLLQEYGNISIKVQQETHESDDAAEPGSHKGHMCELGGKKRRITSDDGPRTVVPVVSIEVPD